ncbi:Uncharacterized protein YbiU [Madurella mycetomatis]|uniref:Uncharacterized protein YbiU n=1 Tax=Madurella mycetomatis TaxID=100816 RepID=A0A175WG45_9PEZI|nr:Uncharacterized protein YbiU [Madurella mycetomatis]
MTGSVSGGGAVSVSTRTSSAGAAATGPDVVMGGTTTATTTTTTTAAAAAAAAAITPTVTVSASLLAAVNSVHGIDKGGPGGLEPRSRCSQCGRRRTVCHHQPVTGGAAAAAAAPLPMSIPTSPSASANAIANGSLSAARPRRISKLKHRLTASIAAQTNSAAAAAAASPHNSSSNSSSANDNNSATMEPPVLSFYGKEPVPLPSRFAHVKRTLVAGHEAEIEASWARLLDALRDEVDHISSRGSSITPSIDFADINNPDAATAFARDLKRYGLGVVRGVVPRTDAQVAIEETVKYLEKGADFKEPTPQDPTCFDLFWTPAQVRTRAHPRVMEAQRFAMSLWDNAADDRMAIRFPIAYGDRLRIHGANIGGVGPDATAKKAKDKAADDDGATANEDLSDEAEAQRIALELLGDFASSTVIAQVDNGSLERWEPDGYGRGGTYASVFKGEWEKYNPWDPTFRVSSTQDLYNGHGACSIFRMYQGIVALSTIEPGLIRLLPSPKLAAAYFLLRPFFSPKTRPPERRDGPEWEAFLDASNWALDKDQSTIIHGAVPGHAQRLTELWHPHLHLRRTLVTIPTLQTGDYIIWHPDLAYHITSNPNVMASRAPTPPPMADGEKSSSPSRPVTILVYVPAAPLTQTSALYLARQRKTFQRGHPSPDFDATGSGLGSEASHGGRPGETYIAEVGGPAALQAMGLAPFDVAPTPPDAAAAPAAANGSGADGDGDGDGDVEMSGAVVRTPPPSMTRAEAEVARLSNIILFPDRYDFYMAKRNGNGTKRSKVVRKEAKGGEKEGDKQEEKKNKDKDNQAEVKAEDQS